MAVSREMLSFGATSFGRCVVSGRFANGAAVSAVRGAAYGAAGGRIQSRPVLKRPRNQQR